MKCIIALIFALACAVAAPPSYKRGGFKLSGRYAYDYTAKMRVEMAETDQHLTQLQMEAKVELHFLPVDDEVMLKVTDFLMYDVVKDAARGYEELNTESALKHIIEKYIKMPIYFGYKYGLVKKIFSNPEDPLWSVNMKKSIVNLFQVDMQGKDQETDSNVLFGKQELSVFGICNTTYRTNEFVVTDGLERTKVGMNITKVIDTNNCTSQSNVIYNSIVPRPLEVKDDSPLDSTAIIQYDVIGNELNFKIERINATGLYAVYPFARGEESILAVTQQLLILREETGSLSESRPATGNLKDHGGLVIAIPPLEKPEFLFSWQQKDFDRLADFVLQTLGSFINEFSPEQEPTEIVKTFTTEHTDTILVLINSMKLCNVDLMEKMWTKSDMKTRKWLVYILSKCSTEECIKFFLSKIKSSDLSRQEIEEYLVSASFFGKPTAAQVETMFEICQLPIVTGNDQLKTSCYASTSNMLKTVCRVQTFCPTSTAFETKILQMVQKLTSLDAESEECKYIEGIPTPVLLSIAENMLTKQMVKPEFFNLLERIILRQELPSSIRVKALMACKPLIRMNPKRLRIVLMKLIHDFQEHIEVRMIAFDVLMENPTSATVQICSRHMHLEPSLQVRRFIYDHIRYVATGISRIKYSREIIRACRMALNVFSPIAPAGVLQTSRHFEMAHHFQRLNTRVHGIVDTISTNEAIIPRHIHGKLNMTFFGNTFTVLDTEMRMEGVQEYIEKFLGADGIFYKKKSILDFIRKMPTESDAMKLKVPGDKMDLFSQVKLFDKIFFVYHTTLNKNLDLQNLLLEGALFRAADLELELKGGKVFNWIKPIVPMDVLYKLPTLIGVPLHCNMTSIMIPRVKTEVKAEVKPHVFSTATLLSKERDYAQVSVKHGLSGVGQVVSSIFFSLPICEVGMTMRSTMNVSTIIGGTVSWTRETGKFEIEMDLPQETRDIVTVKRERYHFIKPYPIPETSVETTFIKVKAEPSSVGELRILKQTPTHCTACRYEEWILQTSDKKYLSVKDNQIVIGDSPTVFHVYFHGRQRNLINLFVPSVGHVTMSRKSEWLVIKPTEDAIGTMGKVFRIEYKSLNTIVLRTWVVMEKLSVPKEWKKLESHVAKQQIQEYEKVRQVMYERKENLMENDEIPYSAQHIQETYLAMKNNRLCVTPVMKDALVVMIKRGADLEDELRRATYNGGFCIGEKYNVKLCLQGYYTMGRSRYPAIAGPMELRLRLVANKNAPQKVKVLVNQMVSLEDFKVTARVSVVKATTEEVLMKLNGLWREGTVMDFKLESESSNDLFKNICLKRISMKDEYRLMVSLDKPCQQPNFKMDLVTPSLAEQREWRKTMTLRFNYTTTGLPRFWQVLVKAMIRQVIMPYLQYNSKHSLSVDNMEWNGVQPRSAVVDLVLTSEHTIRMKLLTAKKTLVFDDIVMPYPIHSFPVGSKQVPVIERVKDLLTPVCSVRGSAFITFDKANYEYNPTGECLHTLVRECAAVSRFTVYVRRQMPDTYALRILDGLTEYDIVPRKLTTEQPIFQVAGEEVKFTDKYVKLDTNKNALYTITWEVEHQNLVFTHHKLGLVVSLRQGRMISVQPSQWYHNKLCGLCGNFDGDKSNDLRTPESIIPIEPSLFGSSWINPAKTCGGGCSKTRTRLETRVTETLFCQSRIPVVQCMATCKPVAVRKIRVQSVCVPNSAEQKTKLRESFTRESLLLTKDMSLDVAEVEVPTQCSCDCQNTKEWKKQDA